MEVAMPVDMSYEDADNKVQFNESDNIDISSLNDKYIRGKAKASALENPEPELKRKRVRKDLEEDMSEIYIPVETGREYAGTDIYRNNKKSGLFIAVMVICATGGIVCGGLLLTTSFLTKSIVQTSSQLVGITSETLLTPDTSQSAGVAVPASGLTIPAFKNADAAAKALNISVEQLAGFDSIVQSVMAIKTNLVLRDVFMSDSPMALSVISDAYNIFNYITAVASVTESTALIEAAAIAHYAREYNLSPALVVGVAQKESTFNPLAASHKGALGPMQVMWDIHYALLSNIGIKEKNDLLSADYGIKAGCFLLSRYMKDKQTLTGALRSYYGELNSNYISGVMTYRHAYELFSQGVTENPVNMSSTENVDWKRMTNQSAPAPSKSKSKAKASVSTGKETSTIVRGSKEGAVKQGNNQSLTTVYNNTEGRIKIQRPDGSVLIQKAID